MRVALIGGTAFIGRALAHELAGAGHELCVVHRGTHEPDDLPGAVHIHTDRAELGSVGEQIRAFDPEVVVDNIAMTRADAESALAAFGTDVRWVVTSSMDVYRAYTFVMNGGCEEAVPIREEGPVRDERYPYRGQGNARLDDYEKLDVEEVMSGAGATVLRLPIVYGPNDGQRREEFVLRRVRAGRERIPVGPGTWLATKGFVGDVARGMRLAVESAEAAGEVLNLGESVTHAMRHWTQLVLDAAGSGAELVQVPEDKLPPDMGMTATTSQHLLVDSSKARALLRWQDTPAAEALRISVRWHLDNPPPDSDPDFSADDEALEAAEV